MGQADKIMKWILRCGFTGWLIFEFLNLIKVLDFTLDFSWLGIMLTASFIWGAIEITSYRINKSTGQPFPWLVYLIGLIGTTWDALGDVAHFYSRYEWYDQVAHALGAAAAALVIFFALWRLKEAGKLVIGDKLLATFSFCSAAFLSVLYEVEEYLEDVFFHTNRLGNGVDTANDLLWNTVGSIIIVFTALYIMKRLKKTVYN